MKWLTCLLLLIPALASAATYHVPEDYATIQAGIDACVAGDTVLVAPGTYTLDNEFIRFNGKDIALVAEGGTAMTTIQRSGIESGVRFLGSESRNALISGFRLTGTTLAGGGAIAVPAGASPTLRDLLFEHTGRLEPDPGSMEGSTYGDALKCLGAPLVQGCVFENNTGGGGCVVAGGDPEFVDVVFRSNSARYGGAVSCTSGSPQFTRCTFTANRALRLSYYDGWNDWYYFDRGVGGAILVHSLSTPRFEDCLFLSNSAEGVTTNTGVPMAGMGGAVCVANGGAPNFVGCTFRGNRAEVPTGASSSGGAFAFESESAAVIERCLVAWNSGGGGLYVSAGSTPPALWCCDVYGNTGGDYLGFPFDPTGIDGNISEDPQFCQGNSLLEDDSPCLPESSGCGELIGALGEGCTSETPVQVAVFTVSPSAGAVDLTWQATLGEFRLTASAGETTWDVPWTATGEGVYAARDNSPQLAPGGGFVYTLEGREPGETWQLLRALTVTVPPAFATRLFEPHPNPFNPKVTVPFSLAAPGRVRVEVFDLAGRRVATLADRRFEGGAHDLTWDGADQASGVYLLRFSAAGHTESKRLVLLR